MGIVPVIDVSADRDGVARAIDDACRHVGFFQMVGHGIDPQVEAEAWELARRFFRLPLADKLAVAIPPGDAYGYGAYRVERLAASLGAASPPDLKETFSIGPATDGDEPDDPAAAFVYSPTPWPAEPPGLAASLRRYYDELAGFVGRLMSLMALGLGLAPDHFEPFIDRHTSALRLLHYPDLTDATVEPGQLRAGAHTDYGTLTLLRQDDAPGGLQVRGRAGWWHDVAPVRDAYVVNIGDAMERWTNDRWRSTLHRVVVPPADAGRDCTRQSIAFFHNANWDAVIECLPTCREPGADARHESTTAGRHLMDKFLSTQS